MFNSTIVWSGSKLFAKAWQSWSAGYLRLNITITWRNRTHEPVLFRTRSSFPGVVIMFISETMVVAVWTLIVCSVCKITTVWHPEIFVFIYFYYSNPIFFFAAKKRFFFLWIHKKFHFIIFISLPLKKIKRDGVIEWLTRRSRTSNLRIASCVGSNPASGKPLFPWARELTGWFQELNRYYFYNRIQNKFSINHTKDN